MRIVHNIAFVSTRVGFGTLALLAIHAVTSVAAAQFSGQPMLDQLRSIGVPQLVNESMERGDAQRGAILFHQAQLQCAKCHATGREPSLLGPNLAKYETKVTREHLIESILEPSKHIREGYQTIIVLTDDGISLTGILAADDGEQLIVRDASNDGRETSLDKQTLEDWTLSKQSLMPVGLVDQLGTREQFFDLARYVIEIAEQGADRARELEPPAALTQLPPLPEYEQEVDHRGMISSFDSDAFERGQKIYNRVCANCHGTAKREGSLPTAPRFATGKLKNGSDPYRLYQTLTHGYGMMMSQRWMVPQQKYDVIHYVREAYFKKRDPALYSSVEPGYLAKVPAGTTRGPEPVRLEPYVIMDYGPSLIHTYEIQLNNSGDEEHIGWNLGRGPSSRNPWANPDEYFAPARLRTLPTRASRCGSIRDRVVCHAVHNGWSLIMTR